MLTPSPLLGEPSRPTLLCQRARARFGTVLQRGGHGAIAPPCSRASSVLFLLGMVRERTTAAPRPFGALDFRENFGQAGISMVRIVAELLSRAQGDQAPHGLDGHARTRTRKPPPQPSSARLPQVVLRRRPDASLGGAHQPAAPHACVVSPSRTVVEVASYLAPARRRWGREQDRRARAPLPTAQHTPGAATCADRVARTRFGVLYQRRYLLLLS